MDKERRKRVSKVLGALIEAKNALEALMGEEQGAFENLPISLQDAQQGQDMEAAAGELGDASGHVEDAIDVLESMGA